MELLKNLCEVSKEEQKKYINSFDQVLLDIDGVILIYLSPIPGAPECVQNFKKLGKEIHYVTNNNMMLAESISKALNERNFVATPDDIVNPIQTTIGFLGSMNIEKNIYAIGLKPMKQELKKVGFNLVPDPPLTIEENTSGVLKHYESNGNVGAVILDYDMNLNYVKLQKASWYLQNPDCAFIVTIRDKIGPAGTRGRILGMYHFVEALRDLSGREYIEVGKPSMTCVNYIKEKYNVTDPRRVLFVGDSIESDMSTGANGGFQKLLVLSGSAKIEDIQNWKYPEAYKPEYYVQDVGVLNNIIKSIFTEL